jgi:signal transduction histidine kinase
MTLARFITENMEGIVAEWQTFATTMEPAASTMTGSALRDRAKPILQAIAKDLESGQIDPVQSETSSGPASALSTRETAAATHEALRHVSGFDLSQLGAEYRALRASVVRLWAQQQSAVMDPAIFEEMIRFNDALDQAVAESASRHAAELAVACDTFAATVAHDLRSPLNAINMVGFLIERGATTDKLRAQAGQLLRSAKEMGTIIRELHDYARTRLGQGMPVAPGPCSLLVICRGAVEEVQAAHPDRQLVLEVPDDLVGTVDEGRLRQALSYLLDHAVQHADAASPITLASRRQGQEIVIQVRNLGEPIPPESLQVIFDPVVQLSSRSAGAPAKPSTNLGLFIAREVALGHQGGLDVASDADNGTVFTLRLPAGAAPARLPPA